MVGKKTELVLQRAVLSSDGMSSNGAKSWKDVKAYNGVLSTNKATGSTTEVKFASGNQYLYRIYYDPLVEIVFADRFYSKKKEMIYEIISIENSGEQDKILVIGLTDE